MKSVTLKKNQDKRVLAGHPWVFSNEIGDVSEALELGEEVAVQSYQKRLIGRGFYHPRSLIAVRLMTRNDEPIDKRLWVERLRRAWSFRRRIYPQHECYRVIFGESDGISGLVVDKYGSLLVVQVFSAGIERRKQMVLDALIEVFNPRCVIARNDFVAREQEGLPQSKELWFGEMPEAQWIEQDAIRFWVDSWNGQKTGFFFDQRDNRVALQQYVTNQRVLDCFSYSGGFALYSAAGAARSVLAVDASSEALKGAEVNFKENRCQRICSLCQADIFEFLKQTRDRYDVVVLDPPALVKRKISLKEGLRGYQNLNQRALARVEPGGILATCCCSYHVTEEDFRAQLVEAARRAGREIQLLESRTQARDHPILLAVRETSYLKCLLLRVL
ncbi:MAG: class I SAM-dependent rRNA methyltransferase [Deltaproteobacteria bacterium]|nr:class I SAM-dependent rRNA methyltransferase [Deltaproteobacteria bacterium]